MVTLRYVTLIRDLVKYETLTTEDFNTPGCQDSTDYKNVSTCKLSIVTGT